MKNRDQGDGMSNGASKGQSRDEEKSKVKSKEEEKSKIRSKEENMKATDPQESMRGPVSSLVQKIKEGAEENDEKEQDVHELKKNNSGGDFINH